MKKLIVGFLVCMLLAVTPVFADDMSVEKTVAITLGVNGVFGFQVWDIDLAQTFTLDPGEAAIGDIHFYATSNHGNQWMLAASSDGLDGEFNFGHLDVSMSTFDGAGAGLTGTFVTDLVLIATSEIIYTSGVGEGSVSGLEVSGLIVIPIAPATLQDLYTGTVLLSMTE